MKSIINELWHGNIIPQEDSRTNSKEMKELLGYMARHHENLEKSFTDEQKKIYEKFHVAKSETIEYRFGRVKPPKERSWQSRSSAGDRQRLCDGGERLGRVRKPCRSSHLRIRLPPRSEVSDGGSGRYRISIAARTKNPCRSYSVKTLLHIKICASICNINEVCYLFLDSSLILFFAVNKPISDDLHYTSHEKRS